MRILITGGAGFIGSAVIRHLVTNTDNRVVNADKRTCAGNLESLTSVSESDRYIFEHVDKSIEASKAERESGWTPEVSFETGLRKTVKWYLDNRQRADNIVSVSYREWVGKHYGVSV